MAINLPISTWIEYAKTSQWLRADKISRDKIFNGKTLFPDYVNILRVVRSLVEFAYDRNPDDPTLYETSLFMRTLVDSRAIAIASDGTCVAPAIITQPSNQTVTAGGSAIFFISASGTDLTYQWQKGGVDIPGATSSIYQISSTVTGDAGSYRCVVTNTCGTATSNAATLTVNAALITGDYYYGDTDYYSDINAGTDAVPYQGTFSFAHDADLSVPFPTAANNNKFLIVRVPRTETDKDQWVNTVLNNGTIPDSVFPHGVTKPAGLPSYTYYISIQAGWDFSSSTLQLNITS